MCSCANVEIGSYANQIELPRPAHMIGQTAGTSSDTICIDKCLEDEIKYLWSIGISTTGCCCGHNKIAPFIGVIDSDIQRMKKIGYTVALNPLRPDSEDSFTPIVK